MMKKVVAFLLVLLSLVSATICAADSMVIEVTKATSIRTESNFNAGKVRLAQPEGFLW